MPHRSLPCPQDLAGPMETDDQVWPRQVPLYSKTSRRDFDSAVAAFGIRALACSWNCCFFLVADVANHSGSQSLTFDVEDYFHTEAMASVVNRSDWEQMPSRVLGNAWRLFEILAEHKVRATFFFLGWVAEKFPELAQNAARLGHEVACHSYWHR